MALLPLSFPPGIYRNGTEYQAKGRWYDANLIRFYEGTIRPIGGWRTKNRTGALTDPFSTVNTTPTVTVAHIAHGLRVGDRVLFLTSAAVGGLTMNNVNWTVASVPGANSYTFTHTSNATSTAGPAGGATTYAYTQAVTGKARGIATWKDNTLITWAGIGTESKLYILNRAAQLFDITPAGFTAGISSAIAGGGYGNGSYGTTVYGIPRADSSLIQDVTTWSLDTFGQYLDGCTVDDGKIYEWQLNTGVVAAAVTNAPTARAIVVTEEGFLFALGAAGVPRRVQWCDQRNNTLWAAAATNQAGSLDLQTVGKLMQGKKVRGATLIWTDIDVHVATYIGGVFIYSFNRLAENCGAISQNCVASLDAQAVWMGRSGFWLYNGGYVSPLPCDVSDYIFSSLNSQQCSKVSCFVNSQYGEVTWLYPSGPTNENDSYVTWNYRAASGAHSPLQSAPVVWTFGKIVRLSGADRGALNYPLLMGNDGFPYEHEVGFNYDGTFPYIESGPFELGNGDNVMHATSLIPDFLSYFDVTVTFKVKILPNGSEYTFGPYTLTENTDVRFTGRQAKVRFTGIHLSDWRVGTPRLDVTPGGKR